MEKVKLLGEEMVKEEELARWVYNNLKPTLKMNRAIHEEMLQESITKVEKWYHPMWVIKLLIIAERKPFPSKVTPNMIFVDGRSGYRGLFTSVPPQMEKEVPENSILRPSISKQEALETYVRNVQEKQIDRKYVLKKPKYEIKETDLLYLPLWQVEVDTDFFKKTCWINGNTGESEELLMKLCSTGEWII